MIAGGAVYAVKTDRIALPGALSAKQKQLDDMSVAEAAKKSEVTKCKDAGTYIDSNIGEYIDTFT